MTQKVDLIFEDDYILVLNKPSGMVVNISDTSPGETLQNYTQEKLAKELADADKESDFYKRGGLVHRIDKETSGVVVAAKDEETFVSLQVQFKGREVEKEYVALIFGKLDEEKIEISAPIGRSPRNRTKMAIVSDGKEAVTTVEQAEERVVDGEVLSLVRAFPKTGRTHQIRVHLAALNHPIVGDDLYAGKRRSVISRKIFGRLMLHAHKITFTHPKTGERASFEAGLPSEFAA
ncbi:hypothetical protein A2886_02220 [candidate division WWE3 bacterium RIFCSPHIGHO2_01_FULL_42_13]|uniref:Pseudouridine synthase n=1 Tax=candidate division WWE3 bacterium RIFCSPHIGHO2_01_FULL_42_13 TaxID=1802617 RepID=A0A1F4URI0_UNCKA|nr:MAG: hypothetical protein A2886_02220 [candidate division WWE3 bacterium RIFCSPHIGHO2_01_FULL_42_13]